MMSRVRDKREAEQLLEIGKRFWLFCRILGKRIEEIAVELQRPVSVFRGIREGDMESVYVYGVDLMECYGLNLNWLLLGEGKMFTADSINSTCVEQKLLQLMAGSKEIEAAIFALVKK